VLDASTSPEGVIRRDRQFPLARPGSFADPLTDVLRDGARTLLAQAVEADVAALLSATSTANRRRAPAAGAPRSSARTGGTGIGPVAVRRPRVRDRVEW
jgi:putative transposase